MGPKEQPPGRPSFVPRSSTRTIQAPCPAFLGVAQVLPHGGAYRATPAISRPRRWRSFSGSPEGAIRRRCGEPTRSSSPRTGKRCGKTSLPGRADDQGPWRPRREACFPIVQAPQRTSRPVPVCTYNCPLRLTVMGHQAVQTQAQRWPYFTVRSRAHTGLTRSAYLVIFQAGKQPYRGDVGRFQATRRTPLGLSNRRVRRSCQIPPCAGPWATVCQ